MSYGSFVESSGEWLEDECRYEFDGKPDGVVLIADGKRLVFVPERTCKIEPTTCKNEIFIERIHEYECYACNELVPMYINDGRPNYCSHCGVKAVG